MNEHDSETLAPRPDSPTPPASVPRRRSKLRSPLTLLLVVAVGFVLTGGIDLGADAGSFAEGRETVREPRVPVDTDGDGIFDHIETNGWKTRAGNIYRTDPAKFDSDGDGLSDSEEAGALTANAEFENAYSGLSNPLLADTDADGLDDPDELALGLEPYDSDTDDDLVQDGPEHSQLGTNPLDPDSDGDGLTDGDEVGALIASSENKTVYAGYSNPLVMDSDGDGLGDADEADLGLNPFQKDTDGDGLRDSDEIELVGSAPDIADTDGDSYDDKFEYDNREAQGLNPLWVDAKVSKKSYAIDFAKGALLGDLDRVDSVAWLAGSLSAGAVDFIPGAGNVVGTVTDVRDAVGSAIRADWVGAGFSLIGAVPAGNGIAIPGKVGRFIARNRDLAVAVAKLVESIDQVPGSIKIQAGKMIWKSWTVLNKAGALDETLIRLQKGRVNLDDVAKTIDLGTGLGTLTSGAIYVSSFLENSRAGYDELTGVLRANGDNVANRVRVATTGCGVECTTKVRMLDAVVNEVAHETKVGYVSWSNAVQNQINVDAWLVKTGKVKGAHWHFYASARTNTIGADHRVIDLLVEKGIPFTVYLPNTP